MEAVTAAVAFLGLKAGTIIAAATMALLSLLLDTRRHSWPTALLAILSGVAAAIIFTDPLADYLHLSEEYKNAVAGVLGIGGRNMIIMVSRLTRDPALLVRIWRGEADDDKDR